MGTRQIWRESNGCWIDHANTRESNRSSWSRSSCISSSLLGSRRIDMVVWHQPHKCQQLGQATQSLLPRPSTRSVGDASFERFRPAPTHPSAQFLQLFCSSSAPWGWICASSVSCRYLDCLDGPSRLPTDTVGRGRSVALPKRHSNLYTLRTDHSLQHKTTLQEGPVANVPVTYWLTEL